LIIPEEIRGRYFAFHEMWNRTIFQFALLFTGTMLDLVGLETYMLVLSGIIFAGFVMMYYWVSSQKLNVEVPSAHNQAA
jgi:hypothetical protein